MPTATAKTKAKAPRQQRVEGERRWLIPDLDWQDYEELGQLLPERFRLTFDGSSLEIMVTSQLHDDYADALDSFFKAVAGALGVLFKPYRSATWARPELQRAIEADNCYYLNPVKIRAGLVGRAKKSRKVEDYPNPDLAIEVDLSPPKIDREGIYAALKVAELWTFDGANLIISRLDKTGRYRPVKGSAYLPISSHEVPRWIIEEDLSDYEAWTQRIRTWAKKSLAPRLARQSPRRGP